MLTKQVLVGSMLFAEVHVFIRLAYQFGNHTKEGILDQ